MASAGRILVVNAGSSSLKLRVLDADDALVGTADLPAPRGSTDAVQVADGDRAASGRSTRSATGSSTAARAFCGPVRIDARVIERTSGPSPTSRRSTSRSRWRRWRP